MGLIKFPVSKPSLRGRERELVAKCLDDVQLTQGPMVAEFENQFAATISEQHEAIACSNGTVALHLALSAMGIGPGDSVLVPDLSFVATANAVSYTGAKPILCEVDRDSWNISLIDAAKRIRVNTRAIIPVHLYGTPCDMRAVMNFADAHHLDVIEDAAEGLGGAFEGQPLGSFGDAATFSFYGNKIITTGEGGAVVTRDAQLADRVRLLRGQGQPFSGRRYYHSLIGFNYRMTELQAAIGIAQLERLDEILIARGDVCQLYGLELAGRVTTQIGDIDRAPWLFTCLLPEGIDPTQTARMLLDRGIDTRPVFVPMHRLPMYSNGGKQTYPVADSIADRGISLPTHAEMTRDDAAFISDQLRSVLDLQMNGLRAAVRK
jgi:perosamine synthetase